MVKSLFLDVYGDQVTFLEVCRDQTMFPEVYGDQVTELKKCGGAVRKDGQVNLVYFINPVRGAACAPATVRTHGRLRVVTSHQCRVVPCVKSYLWTPW